MMNCNVV